MRLVVAIAIVLVLGVAGDARMRQVQTSSLDRPVPNTVLSCKPQPECVWQMAILLGLPLGFQSSKLADSAAGSAPADSGRFRAPTDAAPATITAREILTKFVPSDTGYEWRDMDGIAVVRPRSAWDDGGDILNQRVEAFDWLDVQLYQAMGRLADIGRFAGGKSSGPAKDDSRFYTVHFNGGSVLQAINAVARVVGDMAWRVEPVPLPSTRRKAGQTTSTPGETGYNLWIARWEQR